MVLVRRPPRLQTAILPFRAEVAVRQSGTGTEQQGERNHADRHEIIKHADIENLQSRYQRAIQPLVAVSFAVLTVLSHSSSVVCARSVSYRHPYFVIKRFGGGTGCKPSAGRNRLASSSFHIRQCAHTRSQICPAAMWGQ